MAIQTECNGERMAGAVGCRDLACHWRNSIFNTHIAWVIWIRKVVTEFLVEFLTFTANWNDTARRLWMSKLVSSATVYYWFTCEYVSTHSGGLRVATLANELNFQSFWTRNTRWPLAEKLERINCTWMWISSSNNVHLINSKLSQQGKQDKGK